MSLTEGSFLVANTSSFKLEIVSNNLCILVDSVLAARQDEATQTEEEISELGDLLDEISDLRQQLGRKNSRLTLAPMYNSLCY
jgi:hypothetical protein